MDFAPNVEVLVKCLRDHRDVQAVTLFGSRTRDGGRDADVDSDVDLQVICRRPTNWVSPEWAKRILPPEALLTWNVRDAFGGVKKISIVLGDGELDLVIVPAARMRLARWALWLGLHRRHPGIRRKLGDIALVMGEGHRVLKGGAKWERFYRRISVDVPLPGMTDEDVRNAVAGVEVDLVSIRRKLSRGELRAAQRWLHTGIAETNFKLMHELRRRRGARSHHDGRRAEQVLPEPELELVTVSARLDAQELESASEAAASATRKLGEALLTQPR